MLLLYWVHCNEHLRKNLLIAQSKDRQRQSTELVRRESDKIGYQREGRNVSKQGSWENAIARLGPGLCH